MSLNFYRPIDIKRGVEKKWVEQLEAFYATSGKPLMNTEWSFLGLDSGLPCKHGMGMRVNTQAERAQCFVHWQTMLFSLPFMVGSQYFMWNDQPPLGISDTFPEDGNYGLVTNDDEAYPELTDAAALLNPQVYKIHARGKVKLRGSKLKR